MFCRILRQALVILQYHVVVFELETQLVPGFFLSQLEKYFLLAMIFNNFSQVRIEIERGPFFLPDHFQNLPLPCNNTLCGLSETFPWTLSDKTHKGTFIRFLHGMTPFFGGKSTLWSAWCPRPTEEEMQGWPKDVIKAAQNYFAEAEKLLNVIPANEIDEGNKKIKDKSKILHS